MQSQQKTEWQFVQEKNVSQYKPTIEKALRIIKAQSDGSICAKFRFTEGKQKNSTPSTQSHTKEEKCQNPCTLGQGKTPAERIVRTSITIQELLNHEE